MSNYKSEIDTAASLIGSQGSSWEAIQPEAVARMRLQNQFKNGLDIAKYTAKIMREDMARYDADPTQYTQSLGCWHGFIGQQKLISIKKHFGTTDRRYLYLSGWMIAALRSEFGPLPDQSMHEKTAVPALIEELYTFLRQADARELNELFRQLDAAREAGDAAFATTGYGVGNWHLYGGRREPAFEIFRGIVATDAWPSFGYIAAEAELAAEAARR